MSGNLSLSYSKVNQQSNQLPIKTSLAGHIDQNSNATETEMTPHIEEETKDDTTNAKSTNNGNHNYKQPQRKIVARLK